MVNDASDENGFKTSTQTVILRLMLLQALRNLLILKIWKTLPDNFDN